MTKVFSFPKSTTADGQVNSDKLKTDIDILLSQNVVIDTDISDIVVTTENDLTQQEEDDLNTVIENHQGSIYPFMLTGEHNNPKDYDYDIFGLIKKRTMGTGDHKGELRTVEYFKAFDPNTQTYIDRAVKEDRFYHRDPSTGLVQYRLMDIYWYDTNGGIKYQKTDIMKLYSFNESREELQTRRKNIINDAEAYLIGTMIAEHGQATGVQYALMFLATVKIEKELYIDSVGQPLLDAIAGTQLPFITQTHKDTLTALITYDYTVSD